MPIPIPRSSYLEQVRETLPLGRLQGRERELRALARFCIQESGAWYSWWQAPAWAGKSALMSWFTLNPPPGVQIVPFFVTAGQAGQGDRTAFVEVVLEQLADLLDLPMPALLTKSTREAHLRRMLADAALSSQSAGQRLVLLVDGLDEDLGVVAGTDAYSIAALLPSRPTGGMRVIVSSRGRPGVPDDVPDNHPLREPAIRVQLAPSKHAAVVERNKTRELRRLLNGSPLEVALLGFVTAAGGGLTLRDLAYLAGTDTWRVEEVLQSVAGRSFESRPARWKQQSRVFVLGHEELQAAAVDHLGEKRLVEYRKTLHGWADSFHENRWPPDTPEYLLRGYFRMLRQRGDVGRMVSCAIDAARHDRLFVVTGGDAAAMAEIEATQAALLGEQFADLSAVGRLALHRAVLRERNALIPSRLAVLWAATGRQRRAEALAMSISDPQRRAHELMNVSQKLVELGEVRGARRAAELAEETVTSIRRRGHDGTNTGARLAETWAAIDEMRSTAMIAQVQEWYSSRVRAVQAVERSRRTRLREDIEKAEQLARNLEPWDAIEILARLATTSATDNRDQDAAEQMLATAELLAEGLSGSRSAKIIALTKLVAPTASLGKAQDAQRLADGIARLVVEVSDLAERAESFCRLAEVSAIAGLRSRAEAFMEDAVRTVGGDDDLRSGLGGAGAQQAVYVNQSKEESKLIHKPDIAMPILLSSAFIALQFGDTVTALRLGEEIERLSRVINSANPFRHAQVACALAIGQQRAMAYAFINRTQRLSEGLDDELASHALTRLLPAMHANDDLDGALLLARKIEARARNIDNPYRRSDVLYDLGDALQDVGERAWGRALIAEATALAPGVQRLVLRKLSEARQLLGAVEKLPESERSKLPPPILDRVESLAENLDPDDQGLLYAWIATTAAMIGTPAENRRCRRLVAMSLGQCEDWTIPLLSIAETDHHLMVELVRYAQNIHVLQDTSVRD